jgi:tetratricopeptide (TPR) repeat protein
MQAEYEKGLPYLEEAIKLKPDLAEAWNNKGVILCDKLGQIEQAILCFDKVLKLKPTLVEPWLGKAEALQKLRLESITPGDMKEAEERALELA